MSKKPKVKKGFKYYIGFTFIGIPLIIVWAIGKALECTGELIVKYCEDIDDLIHPYFFTKVKDSK